MLKVEYVSAVQALYENKIDRRNQQNQFGIEPTMKRGDFAILLHKSVTITGKNEKKTTSNLLLCIQTIHMQT